MSSPKPAQQPKAPATEIKHKKAESDAPPPSEAVLSSRDFVNEPEPAAEEGAHRLMIPSAPDEARPTSGRKLLESLPFFQVEAAPYDPKVPPLPTHEEVPVEPGPSSGLFDIRGMLAVEEEAQKQNRADDELVNLSGGLFNSNAAAPIAPPDAKSFSGGGAAKAPARAEAPRAAAAVPAAPTSSPSNNPPPPSKFAPVITAVGPASRSTKELVAAKRSARVGWVVALVCGGAAVLLLGLKLGQTFGAGADSTPSASAVTSSAAAPESTSKADLFPPVHPRRAEEPSVDDSPAKPKTSGEPDKPAPGSPSGQALGHAPSAVASGPLVKGTSAPSGAPDAKSAGAAVTAAPTEAAPSGGVEFNKTAAKTALAMAAAAAAGCKQADDPSGGAKVSVTFAPSGRVTSAKVVSPPFQGTPTGGCIASAFRSANVPPFDGGAVTTTWDVSIR